MSEEKKIFDQLDEIIEQINSLTETFKKQYIAIYGELPKEEKDAS